MRRAFGSKARPCWGRAVTHVVKRRPWAVRAEELRASPLVPPCLVPQCVGARVLATNPLDFCEVRHTKLMRPARPPCLRWRASTMETEAAWLVLFVCDKPPLPIRACHISDAYVVPPSPRSARRKQGTRCVQCCAWCAKWVHGFVDAIFFFVVAAACGHHSPTRISSVCGTAAGSKFAIARLLWSWIQRSHWMMRALRVCMHLICGSSRMESALSFLWPSLDSPGQDCAATLIQSLGIQSRLRAHPSHPLRTKRMKRTTRSPSKCR